MTDLEPVSKLQPAVEPHILLNVQEMQFWLDKAVAWGQADSPHTQKDTCLHLNKLGNFLQQLLIHINSMVSRFREKLSSFSHRYFCDMCALEEFG